jgi:DNA repair exonuclease SbcCD ATPase subunit
MNFSAEFRQQLRVLESAVSRCQDGLKKIKSRKLRLCGQLDGIRRQMGWREKYFCGWFGGDKRLVQEARETKVELADALVEEEAQSAAIETAERECLAAVAAHLAEHDQEFRSLDQRYSEVSKVKSAADELSETIDRALSEIDDAESMETLDLVSKNKGIAILSHLENDEANEAIGEVKLAAQRFQAALETYNSTVKEGCRQMTAVGRINDDIDLVLDLIGDGFDFMSLFTLSQLSDAEDALNEMQEKSASVIEEIDAKYRSLREQCDRRIAEARRSCA